MGSAHGPPKEFFSAPRASVWSKSKGGQAPRASPLDPPLSLTLSAND